MAKIGIFDSGYGGLTILEAIRRELPQYDYLYLGDNARAPYGTHSFDVIYRYTLQAVKYLFSQDCALVILACNTASAKALRTIQQKDLPLLRSVSPEDGLSVKRSVFCQSEGRSLNVLGVIRPTVEAVPSITKTGHIGILATPATVSSESYVLELQKQPLSPSLVGRVGVGLSISQQACPLWVPLIENGEHLGEGADYFVDLYLRQILEKDPLIDTLILGCTHYPLLLPKISQWIRDNGKRFAASDIQVISQGYLEAKSLADYLRRHPEYESQLSKTTAAPSISSSSHSSSSSPSSSSSSSSSSSPSSSSSSSSYRSPSSSSSSSSSSSPSSPSSASSSSSSSSSSSPGSSSSSSSSSSPSSPSSSSLSSLSSSSSSPSSSSSSSSPMGSCHYLTTENADRFSQSASLFLASPVQAEHIDLE